MEFGAWLAKKRNEAGFTQKQLAEKCKLTAPYVARLESGSVDPPPYSTCKVLARALSIPSDQLWELSFSARMKRWLKREGYSRVPEADVSEFVKKLLYASHQLAK